MNNIEGNLQIDLYPSEGRVEIHSTRPTTAAAQVFAGRTAGEALTLLPGLFSVCGTAQACAGARACEQALGLNASPATESVRNALVHMETAREHLWRILLDWPGFLGEQPDRRAMAEASALHQTFRRTISTGNDLFLPGASADRSNTMAAPAVVTKLGRLLEQTVFAMPAEVWITLEDEADLTEWAAEGQSVAARLCDLVLRSGWSGLGRSNIAPLPELGAEPLRARMAEPGFIAAPTWDSLPWETGPLARQANRRLIRDLAERHSNGLVTRLAARLLELALLPSQIARQAGPEPSSAEHQPGIGLAQVEAARGRLVHAVELVEKTIASYLILAPTEWNFHPAGAVAQGLAILDNSDRETLRRQATLLINAVDPCVEYRLEIC